MDKRNLQVVHMEESVAESVRDLVNPPHSHLPELSFEAMVTTSELDMLIGSAQRTMQEQPTVKTNLSNGDKVLVTRHAAPFVLDDTQHYVRLMQYRGDKKSQDVYLLFDMTESAEQIMVRDPNLFRLESGDDTVRGVYVNTGKSLPELNNREQVSFAQWVLTEIVNVKEQHNTATAQAAEQAKELRARQKEAAKRQKSLKRAHFWDGVMDYGPVVGLGLSAVGGITLLGVALTGIEEPTETFDKHHYKLDGGSIARIGGAAVSPEFSFQLLHSEHLEASDIPELAADGDIAGPEVDDGQDRSDRANINELRQFRVPTDDKDEACETAYVNYDSPDDKVRVWTDYQGNPSNFSVTAGNDTVRVCWNGPKLKDGEMPRIVVQRQPAEAPQSNMRG